MSQIRYVAALAIALLAFLGGSAAMPAIAAAAKSTAAEAKPSAAAKWEGYWAKTSRECRAGDGPDSKTLINLRNSENGKPAPLFDQYENHCRIDSHATMGNVTTLKLTCFEFWDDYKARKSPRRDSVTVTPQNQDRIYVNGAAYIRCKR